MVVVSFILIVKLIAQNAEGLIKHGVHWYGLTAGRGYYNIKS